MVGERLKLRDQQQQLSQQIVEATTDVAEMARGQANNAATSAGATQASIYDLIEGRQGGPLNKRWTGSLISIWNIIIR